MARPKLDLSDPKKFPPEQRFLLRCVSSFLESVGHQEEFVGFAVHFLMRAVPEWRERPAVLGAAVGRTPRMVQYMRDKTPEAFLADLGRERKKTGPEPILKTAQVAIIAEYLLAHPKPSAADLQAWLRAGPLQVDISLPPLYQFLRAHGLNHLLSRNRGTDKKKSFRS